MGVGGWGKKSDTDNSLGLVVLERQTGGGGEIQRLVWVLTTIFRYITKPSQATSSGQPWITMKFLPDCLPRGAVLPLVALLACPGFVMRCEVEHTASIHVLVFQPLKDMAIAPRHSSVSSPNNKTLMIVWTKSEMALGSV